MSDAADRGRKAYARRAWADAHDALAHASAEGPLDADDAERLAWSAMLSGREDASVEGLERLHQLRLDAGEILGAARAAFWVAMRLFPIGENARARGWLARAERLVGEETDCVERGYLKLPQVFRFTAAGDFAAARAVAAEAAEIGDRFRDRDLRAFGRSFEGRALIRQGRLEEGLLVLDEVMVDVASGELSPVVTGVIYCGVIAACQQSYAHDRAREWTTALSRWCDAQPQLIAFGGACLVYRSEILQFGGAWSEALEEAQRASVRLAPTRDFEAGNAFYQEGELHRLRGQFVEAERAFGLASERGREPQPGLALLRLGQARIDVAAAAMRRVLSATTLPIQRTRFLPAYVEVMLAASELGEARKAATELAELAAKFDLEVLAALSHHATGAVLLCDGDLRGAVEVLRRAVEVWLRLGAPYESARSRALIARAFHAQGDGDGAELERDAARRIFVELGATPDVATVDAKAAPSPTRAAHGLSPREVEVLLLVASGKTNKLIAKQLFVSEKTIDRHVSNIFAKLDVPTRAAATAWAYEHGLVR